MHNTTQNSSIVGGEIPETEADVNEQLKALSDSNLKMDYVYMPKDQSFDSTLIVGEMIKLRDGGMVVTTNPEKATAVKDAEQKEGLTKLQNGKLLDYLQPLDSELVGTEIVIEAKYNGNIINSQVVCPDLKDKVIADYAHRFPGAEIATTNVEDHVEARIPEDPFMSRQRFGSEEKTVIVVNDFYDDPDSVREYALSLSYNKDPMYSGYPGMRSKRFSLGPEFMEEVLSYVPPNDITTISSLFQYQTAADAAGSFIHPDPVEWAGVIYLNKDHDGEPGTSFYYHRNRKTGIMPMGTDLMFDAIEAKTSPDEYTEVFREDRLDESKWITLLTVPIRYNRLIMYNARQFHRNASAFGSSKNDARLVQGLFFSDAKTARKNFAGILPNSPIPKS